MARNEELETYQDAVWDFLLEHCDITRGGALFIKFHTDGRKDFERRIRARWKYNYHREDVRAKEARHLETQTAFKEQKAAKKQRYILSREATRKALAKIKKVNDRRRRIEKVVGFVKSIFL